MSIYFFYGDEDYNIEQELKNLRTKVLDSSFSAMNYRVFNNPNFADLISILRTQPMMFGTQMVVIDCEKYFSSSKKNADDSDGGFTDSELKEISCALEDNSESLCVVFRVILPRNEGKKVDSRKKIYKIITKFAKSQEFPTFKTYKTDDIVSWLNKEAKSGGISIERDAAMALIEQIGNNLREFSIELEKLKLLAHPQTKITKQMVKEICISNEDLFNFTDFLLKGNMGQALLEFQRLLEKRHYQEVISATQTMLRKWIVMKLKSKTTPISEVAKLVGQHEFVVKTTLEKMKNTPIKDLVKLKQNLTEAEFNIKSGASVSPVEEFECAFFK